MAKKRIVAPVGYDQQYVPEKKTYQLAIRHSVDGDAPVAPGERVRVRLRRRKGRFILRSAIAVEGDCRDRGEPTCQCYGNIDVVLVAR